MWVLASQNEGNSARIHLIGGKDHIVGRRDCDILITGDQSISRKHAVLNTSHPETNVNQPTKPPIATVTDVSRFGTFVNDDKIEGETPHVLNDGDVIKFGTATSLYSIVYEPFLITTSCLDTTSKKTAKSMMTHLGGHVISEWNQGCDLLIMSSLSVTVKVVCALVSLKPIVTCQYLVELLKSYQNKTAAPHTKNFIPPLAESQLNPNDVSFNPVLKRKTLFDGKLIIFLTAKQLKRLSLAIELAAGTPMLIEEGTNDDDDMLVAPSTIVIATPPGEQSEPALPKTRKWWDHVEKTLHKHGKRIIPDSEVVYAVLFSSLQKYCNPDITMDSESVTASGATRVTTQTVSQQLNDTSLTDTAKPHSESTQILVPNTNINANKSIRRCSGVGTIPETMFDTSLTATTSATENIKKEFLSPQPSTSKRKRVHADSDDDTVRPVSKQPRPAADSVLESDSAITIDGELSAPVIKQEIITPQKHTTTRHKSRASEMENDNGLFADNSASVTIVKDEDDDEFGFSARSTRRGQRGATSVKREPTPEPTTVKTSQESSKSKTSAGDIGGNSDDFNIIPTRGSRSGRSTTHSPLRDVKQESNNNDTEKIDSPVVRQNANDDDDEFGIGTSRRRRMAQKERLGVKQEDDVIKVEEEDDDVMALLADIDGDTMINPGPSTDVKPVHKNRDSQLSNPPASSIDGFLTATHPELLHPGRETEYNEHEDKLPSNVVHVEFRSLVVSTGKGSVAQQRKKNKDATTNPAMWKGKPIKNFKKFRKVLNTGSDGLPRIIGGSDLFIHKNGSRQDVDDWFNEELQAETKQRKVQQAGQELFDYQPKVNRRKR